MILKIDVFWTQFASNFTGDHVYIFFYTWLSRQSVWFGPTPIQLDQPPVALGSLLGVPKDAIDMARLAQKDFVHQS